MKTVAFVGNFDVSYSTESHHALTWENYLGWRVIRLQENRTTTDEVLRAAKESTVLQWTHTHGWDFGGSITQREMVHRFNELNCVTFSYHLDRYHGIGSRENSYLDHPSFHVDTFFSTDGNHESEWKAKNINHHWLLPGVYEGEANYGRPSDSRVGVLFTGATGYHQEYPWRPKMVQALYANYGENFKVVTGVRGQPLNDLYASSTVVVGDHIFAGEPRYCSDRLFEVIGRGGFIVYPKTEGVTENIPGLYTYEPQNIESLFHAIDYFLDKGHEAERLERRSAAHEYVKKNCTYTNRLREVLNVMGIQE